MNAFLRSGGRQELCSFMLMLVLVLMLILADSK
jgi:hypothetical protein